MVKRFQYFENRDRRYMKNGRSYQGDCGRADRVNGYMEEVAHSLADIEATGISEKFQFYDAIFKVIELLIRAKLFISNVFVIGNGGSAAIASEVANRLFKFCNIRGVTFNDPVMLTATANDYGWPAVFSRSLEGYANSSDVLIAISSSGKSLDITRAVETAQNIGVQSIVTFSGFGEFNQLRKMGSVNFYVPVNSYRHVERTHLTILDCILDLLIEVQAGRIDLEGRTLK